jgi:hypothetical protein
VQEPGLYIRQDVTFPVSSLLDVRHIHDASNTGKNVHVKFNTEFECYAWIHTYIHIYIPWIHNFVTRQEDVE